MSKLIDLTGQQFGDFIVLERDFSRTGTTYWKCKCVLCNRDNSVPSNHLRTRQNLCKCRQELKPGTRFGNLTVIGKDEERSKNNKANYYFCECDCGKTISVIRTQLTRVNNAQKSCGCTQSSGEVKIAEILKNNNIDFVQQQSFEDLFDKRLLRYDFAIFRKQ